jgi:hypothetical protein
MGICIFILLVLISSPVLGDPEWYESDFNIFNQANQFCPENPLNPANQFDPDSPFNPGNKFDPENPLNPSNRYNSSNPYNPANAYHPNNPLNPANRFIPVSDCKRPSISRGAPRLRLSLGVNPLAA